MQVQWHYATFWRVSTTTYWSTSKGKIIYFDLTTLCRCSYAEDEKIDQADGINTSGFYLLMGTAQVYTTNNWRPLWNNHFSFVVVVETPTKFGAWASWACWTGAAVCAVLKLCRYHQRENIRVSMAKERYIQYAHGQLTKSKFLISSYHLFFLIIQEAIADGWTSTCSTPAEVF